MKGGALMLCEEKITYKIISVLKLSWDKGSAVAKERPYHALSIRLDGDAEFLNEEDRLTVGCGDIVYVPSGVGYRITAKERETVIAVHFEMLDKHLNRLELFHPNNPDIMKDLFLKMYSSWQSRKIGYEYRVESLFARIMEGLVTERFQHLNSVRADFGTLLGFINANFQDPSLSVNSLAARINVSATYLRRLFNNQLGVGPHKYLAGLRLGYARQLLESGYYTVEDVARMSGYNDPKHFSTMYKRSFGISPGKTGK